MIYGTASTATTVPTAPARAVLEFEETRTLKALMRYVKHCGERIDRSRISAIHLDVESAAPADFRITASDGERLIQATVAATRSTAAADAHYSIGADFAGRIAKSRADSIRLELLDNAVRIHESPPPNDGSLVECRDTGMVPAKTYRNALARFHPEVEDPEWRLTLPYPNVRQALQDMRRVRNSRERLFALNPPTDGKAPNLGTGEPGKYKPEFDVRHLIAALNLAHKGQSVDITLCDTALRLLIAIPNRRVETYVVNAHSEWRPEIRGSLKSQPQ